MTDDTLEAAWAELHVVNDGMGWYIGRPSFDERRNSWSLYSYDPQERPKVGKRSREWIAQHPTQIGVVREMARCLREITAGRVPR